MLLATPHTCKQIWIVHTLCATDDLLATDEHVKAVAVIGIIRARHSVEGAHLWSAHKQKTHTYKQNSADAGGAKEGRLAEVVVKGWVGREVWQAASCNLHETFLLRNNTFPPQIRPQSNIQAHVMNDMHTRATLPTAIG